METTIYTQYTSEGGVLYSPQPSSGFKEFKYKCTVINGGKEVFRHLFAANDTDFRKLINQWNKQTVINYIYTY